MRDRDRFIDESLPLIRAVARRFVTVRPSVWSFDDLVQDCLCEAIAIVDRHRDKSDRELRFLLVGALTNHLKQTVLRELRSPIVFEIDLSEADPSAMLMIFEREFLHDAQRLLTSTEYAIVFGLLFVPETLQFITRTRLASGQSKCYRYVTLGDLATWLGLPYRVVHQTFNTMLRKVAQR